MKKEYLLLLSLCLAGCSANLVQPSNENQESTSSTVESSSNKQSESSSNIESSSSSSSSVDESKRVIDIDTLDIGVNEKYHMISLFKEEYQTTLIDYIFEDSTVLGLDKDDNIIGKKIGTSKLTILVDFEEYQTIQVNVIDDKEAFLKMHFDLANLYNKNITIFGDSISDNSVTAYTSNKPKFWVEMLEDYGVGEVYNHAKSGATVGFSVSMQMAQALDIVATNVVNQPQTKTDVENSDYAFILIGTNDFFRQVTKGEAGDIDDTNYKTKESFVGSYTYLIQKIYSYNPNIKIVCLSTTASTWGLDAQTAYQNKSKCIQTRPLMNQEIKKIAEANSAMYIDLYDLWDENITSYCPDGIHPQTAGYQLMINAIMNHNK